MPDFFNRQYELTVGDKKYQSKGFLHPLQIWAQVETGFDGSNALAEIRIYNLNPDDSSAIVSMADDPRNESTKKTRTTVSLIAGYDGLMAPIFMEGQLINAIEFIDLPDRYITLYCRASADSFKNTVYTKTHNDGVPVESIIMDAAQSFGLPVIVRGDLSGFGSVTAGLSFAENSVKIMDDLASSYGFSWTISNGSVYITTSNPPVSGSVYSLSAESGMIGSPEFDYTGIEVNSVINPQLTLGSAFNIKSLGSSFNFSDIYYQNVSKQKIDGTYIVRNINYSLDYYGDDWSMAVKGWVKL